MNTIPITIQMVKDYKDNKIVPLYSSDKVALSLCQDPTQLVNTKTATGKKVLVVSLPRAWKEKINTREPYLLYDGPEKVYVHKDNAEEF